MLPISACLTISLLSACATPPEDKFYALGTATSATMQQKPGAYSVALGPITLPELVDRPQLVVRNAANRVTLLEHQRWAESLKSAAARVLAANLSAQLDGLTVAVRGANASRDAKYLVLIDMVKFDSVLDEAVTLEALWSVRAVEGAVLKSGKASVREATQAGSVDALVAAHERALARVSAEIALGVRAAEAGGR